MDESKAMTPAEAGELLQGAIDLHCHVNPHLRPEIHSQTALAYAEQAREAGMRAIVLKDVGPPTTGTAVVVKSVVQGIEVYGSLVMNLCNGGINAAAVAICLEHGDGARIIFFPTGDTLKHALYREKFYAGVNPPTPREKAITILRDGALLPEVFEVLDLIARADRCLATAHLSPSEILPLVKEARARGVRRIVINHALWRMVGLTLDQLRELVKLGAFAEVEAGLTMPFMWFIHGEPPLDPRKAVELVRALGAESVILSTDLGQAYSPVPVEGYRMFMAALLKCGLTPDEIRTMACRNPGYLLGLDEGAGAARAKSEADPK
jgi:hypothetical protein